MVNMRAPSAGPTGGGVMARRLEFSDSQYIPWNETVRKIVGYLWHHNKEWKEVNDYLWSKIMDQLPIQFDPMVHANVGHALKEILATAENIEKALVTVGGVGKTSARNEDGRNTPSTTSTDSFEEILHWIRDVELAGATRVKDVEA
ncbi:hypothetical protein FGRMN_5388 [Fusarium graminum]|nr:hypothetical protein FGRMN_5388 [Fusarium graminum]